MKSSMDKPKRLERISFWGAWIFIVPSIIFAFFEPVAGIPLYGKGLLGGIVFLMIYASFKREREGRRVRDMGKDDATRHHPQPFS